MAMPQKKKKSKPRKIQAPISHFHHSLESLYSSRTGGKVAIQGLLYQAKYSYLKILEAFADDPNATGVITLEGFEDLDYSPDSRPGRIGKIHHTNSEYIQVKYASDKMDASSFWKKEILQHFFQLYTLDQNARFTLVTNHPFRDGELQSLIRASKGELAFDASGFSYWKEKLNGYIQEKFGSSKSESDKKFDIKQFIQSIQFEVCSEESIDKGIATQLIQVGITSGNERLFALSISWNVICWSRERKRIFAHDFHNAFEQVKRDIGKGIVNPAIQQRWVEVVDFQKSVDWNEDIARDAYFSGKAAKPFHIASGYPIERDSWKKQIIDLVQENNVVVLRASSGQGKSTLAWQSALALESKGFSVLELVWCERAENIGSIVELLDSYLKSGRRPLVVLDGLNERQRDWGELVKRCVDMPVSFLVTTREEDWRRYQGPEAEVKIMPIDIILEEAEAKSIFERFQQMNKVHHSVHSWRSAWEQVADRALLLEYTYLLSFGTMIEDRIKAQVAQLEKDTDGKGKLEILRLISFADVCEVKLDSSRLLRHVYSDNRFQSDRGKVLEALHKEYHIFIEEGYAIEGLHPVRSRHISEILHGTGVSASETAINLLGIIEPEFYRIMATNCLPFIPEGKYRLRFIDDFADAIQKFRFKDKISILEGFLAFDAREFTQKNQKAFDELFRQKCLQIALPDVCPWSNSSFLFSLFKTTGENEKTIHVRNIFSDIKTPILEEHHVYFLLQALSEPDITAITERQMKGLGYFVAWRNLFKMPAEKIFPKSFKELLSIINFLGCEEASHFAMALSTYDLERYLNLIRGNEEEFLSVVKAQTGVFSIREIDEGVKIEYPVRLQFEKDANGQSVEKLYQVASFFPGKGVYEIFGIYPPFPWIEKPLEHLNPSHKRFEDTSAIETFQPLVNGIWYRECLKRYEFMTYFEWLERIFLLRKAAIDLVEPLAQFVLAFLEGNMKRDRLIKRLDISHQETSRLLDISFGRPTRTKETPSELNFKKLENSINKWEKDFERVNQMFLDLFNPQNQDGFRVAHFNVRNLAILLPEMQRAFHAISNITKHEFPTSDLEKREGRFYQLLADSVVFLFETEGRQGVVRDARMSVKRHIQDRNNQAIQILKENLENYGFNYHLPKKVYDDGVLTYLFVGIERDNLSDEAFTSSLLCALFGVISEIDVTYIDVILTENGFTYQPNGLRLSQKRIKEGAELLHGERTELVEFGIPIPLDKTHFELVPGIKMVELDERNANLCNDFFESAWHVSEARQRLDLKSPHEICLYKRVKNRFVDLRNQLPFIEIVGEMDSLLTHGGILSKDDCKGLYLEAVQHIQEDYRMPTE